MGTFIAKTLQPKSMQGHDHLLSSLLEVTSKMCCRGSKLKQNQASNSSFPLSAKYHFPCFSSKGRRERSQGPHCQGSRAQGAQMNWQSSKQRTGLSDPQQLCRGSAGKQTTVCVHISLPLMGTLPTPLYLLGYFFDPPIRPLIAFLITSLSHRLFSLICYLTYI